MTALLFADLPEQREGPITVGPHMLVSCQPCAGAGWFPNAGLVEPWHGMCRECNGGGQVLVRTL